MFSFQNYEHVFQTQASSICCSWSFIGINKLWILKWKVKRRNFIVSQLVPYVKKFDHLIDYLYHPPTLPLPPPPLHYYHI